MIVLTKQYRLLRQLAGADRCLLVNRKRLEASNGSSNNGVLPQVANAVKAHFQVHTYNNGVSTDNQAPCMNGGDRTKRTSDTLLYLNASTVVVK
jgi:hypothetical protein